MLKTQFCVIQGRYPSLIHSARGIGTFCAIDCKDSATRDKIIAALKNKGLSISFIQIYNATCSIKTLIAFM